jgi:hypothetical protein
VARFSSIIFRSPIPIVKLTAKKSRAEAACGPGGACQWRNDEEFFHPLSSRERAALIATMKKLAQAHRLHTLPTE